MPVSRRRHLHDVPTPLNPLDPKRVKRIILHVIPYNQRVLYADSLRAAEEYRRQKLIEEAQGLVKRVKLFIESKKNPEKKSRITIRLRLPVKIQPEEPTKHSQDNIHSDDNSTSAIKEECVEETVLNTPVPTVKKEPVQETTPTTSSPAPPAVMIKEEPVQETAPMTSSPAPRAVKKLTPPNTLTPPAVIKEEHVEAMGSKDVRIKKEPED